MDDLALRPAVRAEGGRAAGLGDKNLAIAGLALVLTGEGGGRGGDQRMSIRLLVMGFNFMRRVRT